MPKRECYGRQRKLTIFGLHKPGRCMDRRCLHPLICSLPTPHEIIIADSQNGAWENSDLSRGHTSHLLWNVFPYECSLMTVSLTLQTGLIGFLKLDVTTFTKSCAECRKTMRPAMRQMCRQKSGGLLLRVCARSVVVECALCKELRGLLSPTSLQHLQW